MALSGPLHPCTANSAPPLAHFARLPNDDLDRSLPVFATLCVDNSGAHWYISSSVFVCRTLCTPFPQNAYDSDFLSSTSARANYAQFRRPILTVPVPTRRPSSENRYFRFCACWFNVRARLSPARRSRAGCGGMIRLSISTKASMRRSKPYDVPWGIRRRTLSTSRPWDGGVID
jgi:hypothetical protein